MLRGKEQGLAALPRLPRPGHQLVIVPAHAARMSAGAARVRSCLSWPHSWLLQAQTGLRPLDKNNASLMCQKPVVCRQTVLE